MKKYNIFCLALVILSVCLNVLATFPGYLYADMKVMLRDGISEDYSVWHSVFYTIFLHDLTKILPGPEMINILNIALLWGGLGLLSIVMYKRMGYAAGIFVFVPFFPGVLNLSGTPVIDQTLCDFMLLSVVLIFVYNDTSSKIRRGIVCVVILALLCAAFLMRANSLLAILVILFGFMSLFFTKRRILYTFLCFSLFLGSMIFINKTYALHFSSPVTGIELQNLDQLSYYEQKNFFPGKWSAAQEAHIIHGCYRPEQYDNLAFYGKCGFIEEGITGKQLLRLWAAAAVRHPLELFVSDIPTFKNALLSPLNESMMFNWPFKFPERSVGWVDKEPSFRFFNNILKSWVNTYYNSYLSRPVVSVILSLLSVLIIYYNRITLSRVDRIFVYISVSSIVFLMTYFVANMATEYRYYLWTQISAYISIVYAVSTSCLRLGRGIQGRLPVCMRAFLSFSCSLVVITLCYSLPVEHRKVEIFPVGKVELTHISFNYAAFNVRPENGVDYNGDDLRFLGEVSAGNWQKRGRVYVSPQEGGVFRIVTSLPYLDFFVGYKTGADYGSFRICVDGQCNIVHCNEDASDKWKDYLVSSHGHKVSSFHIYQWFFYFLLSILVFFVLLGEGFVKKCDVVLGSIKGRFRKKEKA